MRRRLPRVAWPLLGLAAGLAAAALLTVLQDSVYRADAAIVLVREGQPPGNDPELAAAAEAAATLFDSRAVAASAIANLGLRESPDDLVDRLDAQAEPESSLVRLRVEAPHEDDARRAAQEVAEVSTVLFNDRFGPQTVASVWEPASADPEEVSPRPGRNLALGALAGAIAGWLAFALLGRALLRIPRAPVVRAPTPARDAEGTDPGPVPPQTQPGPGTASTPGAPDAGTGPFQMPGFGQWTIGDVDRLVAEHGHAFPDRREEIELYTETLRSVAAPDGHLPGDVDLVIEDVYGDLIARSGSARRA